MIQWVQSPIQSYWEGIAVHAKGMGAPNLQASKIENNTTTNSTPPRRCLLSLSPYPLSYQPTAAVHGTSSNPRRPSPLSEQGDVCVAITGGAGQIAYALVPLLMQGRVFGEVRKVRLRLLDIEACVGSLQGFAMEIQDCYSDLVGC